MNILICTSQVPFVSGGAELHVENLRRALIEAGHDADVVSLVLAQAFIEKFGGDSLAEVRHRASGKGGATSMFKQSSFRSINTSRH